MTATAERLDSDTYARPIGAEVYTLVAGRSGIRAIRERLHSLWREQHEAQVLEPTKKAALRLAVEITSGAEVSDPRVFLLRDDRHSFEWHPSGNSLGAYASLVLTADGKNVEQYIGKGSTTLYEGSVPLEKGVRTFLLILNALTAAR